jgi:hypothetical protein
VIIPVLALLCAAPAPAYRERPVPDVVPGVYLLIHDLNPSLVVLFADGTYWRGWEEGVWSWDGRTLRLGDRKFRVGHHHRGVWVGDGFRLRREW